MKKAIYIGMCVLLAGIVQGAGMGIIVNMDFGDVLKNKEYTRELQFYPFDTDYYPYTSVPVPSEPVRVVISDTDEKYTCESEEVFVPLNQYSYMPCTLNTKRTRFGSYLYEVCATYTPDGSMFGVGACTDVSYTVVKNLNLPKSKSIKIKW